MFGFDAVNVASRKRPIECISGSVTCPNCEKNGDPYDFHEDCGERVCPDCGCCIEPIFDDGPEKRNFFEGPDHSRSIEVDPFLGLMTSSTIGRGHNVLQDVQKRLAPTETKKQEKLLGSFKTLKQVANELSFQVCVVNTAKWLMSKFLDQIEKQKEKQANGKKRVNGTATPEFSIAFLWVASNYHVKGIAFADLCASTQVKSSKVRKFLGDIQRILGYDADHPTPNPQNYVEQIGFNFNLDYSVTGKAKDFVDRVGSHKCATTCGKAMMGMRPSTLAAACFLKASCMLQKEQGYAPLKEEDVALCAGIEKGTLSAASSVLETHWAAMYPDNHE
jgi:transcription initiation factor TFIIIB Brf1 subunit/transcription initiation factor TFIIB